MTIKRATFEKILSRTGRCVLLGSLAAAAALVAQPTVTEAAPARGEISLSVLLCRFNDVDTEPYDDVFARRFLTEDGVGTGGIADYFSDQSGGNAQVVGTVRDWVEMPRTASTSNSRSTIIQSCATHMLPPGTESPQRTRRTRSSMLRPTTVKWVDVCCWVQIEVSASLPMSLRTCSVSASRRVVVPVTIGD